MPSDAVLLTWLAFSTCAPGGMDGGECAVIFGLAFGARYLGCNNARSVIEGLVCLPPNSQPRWKRRPHMQNVRFSTIPYWLWNVAWVSLVAFQIAEMFIHYYD